MTMACASAEGVPRPTIAGASMTMPHCDDDAALFVPLVHIAMSLGRLFQGIAPVDDRLDFPLFL